KRVPETGARITLTPDAQAIDTSLLGFTVSPHEECAVEEALRIVEGHGGSTTVLTLGPAAAKEQLQNAMAMGVGAAVLLETDGGDDGADRPAAAGQCARDGAARRAARAGDARTDSRQRRRSCARVARARSCRVVILCLVDDDPVSLEALTFARRFGDVEALV